MEGFYSLMVEHLPGMEEVVGSSSRGGRNFSHGKLFKIFIYATIYYLYFQNYLIMSCRYPHVMPISIVYQINNEVTYNIELEANKQH